MWLKSPSYANIYELIANIYISIIILTIFFFKDKKFYYAQQE
jgi:hypothetical protein